MKQTTIESVDRAIDSGRIWRAKEILSGNISNAFDTELYKRYGELLLKMGEDVEAGKYFFLSGAREQPYEQAISLFVNKFTRKDVWNLFYSFPVRARFGSLESYPENTAKDLEALGFPSRWDKKRPQARPQTTRSKIKAYLSLGFVGVILLCLLVGIITGIVGIVSWIGAVINP